MNSNKLLLNGILVFSILSLSIAYFIQYVLGHKPCNLCIIERIPYIAAIILISLVFILNRYQKIISSLILIFFIFGAVVSFYHFGIEQGFFSESLICELTNNNPLNKEELLNQLKKAEIVSCKDVTFRFLGLSLATINTIISLILSGIMFKIIKNYGKN
jgi:disulfide bond formation protein DsbB